VEFIVSAIRPPAVAGLFYPANKEQLAHSVQEFLIGARRYNLKAKALIVPHAGYIYSGAIAATAYVTLIPYAAKIHRVILLGPTHRVAVRGLALPGAEAFSTPLGCVKLD
jgi:AmmeMemoRadiSam system protein B